MTRPPASARKTGGTSGGPADTDDDLLGRIRRFAAVYPEGWVRAGLVGDTAVLRRLVGEGLVERDGAHVRPVPWPPADGG